MTATFKIFTRNQWVQVLGCEENARVFARLINGPKGWMAHRGEEGHDPAAINVSRLINQPNGGELIAKALGL